MLGASASLGAFAFSKILPLSILPGVQEAAPVTEMAQMANTAGRLAMSVLSATLMRSLIYLPSPPNADGSSARHVGGPACQQCPAEPNLPQTQLLVCALPPDPHPLFVCGHLNGFVVRQLTTSGHPAWDQGLGMGHLLAQSHYRKDAEPT